MQVEIKSRVNLQQVVERIDQGERIALSEAILKECREDDDTLKLVIIDAGVGSNLLILAREDLDVGETYVKDVCIARDTRSLRFLEPLKVYCLEMTAYGAENSVEVEESWYYGMLKKTFRNGCGYNVYSRAPFSEEDKAAHIKEFQNDLLIAESGEKIAARVQEGLTELEYKTLVGHLKRN